MIYIKQLNKDNLIYAFLFFTFGIYPFFTGTIISPAHGNGFSFNIGLYGHILGLLLISFGVYILYYEYKKLKIAKDKSNK